MVEWRCPRCGGALYSEAISANGAAHYSVRCVSCGREVVPPRPPSKVEMREAAFYRTFEDDLVVPGSEFDAERRTCLLDYCEKPAFARGWCHRHYFQVRAQYLKTGIDEAFVLAQLVARGDGRVSRVYEEGERVTVERGGSRRVGRVIVEDGLRSAVGWTRYLFVSFAAVRVRVPRGSVRR